MRPQRKADPAGWATESAAKARGFRLPLLSVTVALAVLAPAGVVTSGCSNEASDDSGEVVTLTIPEGTSARLKAGKEVPQIPDRIVGKVGDTLVIRNRDSTVQVVAGYPVSPDQVMKVPLNRPGNYETTCSAHGDDSIKMQISE